MMGTIATATVVVEPNTGCVVVSVLFTLAARSIGIRLLSQVKRLVTKWMAKRWECTVNVNVRLRRERKGATNIAEIVAIEASPQPTAAPERHCGLKCKCRSTGKKRSSKK
jgi:hypothetical protein